MWLVKQMEHKEDIRGRAPQRKSYNGKLPMCASDRRFAFFNNFFVFRVSGRLWHEKLKSCTCFQPLFFFLSVLYDFLNSEWWLRCFVWGQLVMRVWHFEGQRFPGEHSLPIDVLSLTETWFWMSVSVKAVQLCLEFHLEYGTYTRSSNVQTCVHSSLFFLQ